MTAVGVGKFGGVPRRTGMSSDPAEMHFRWRGSWAINSDGSLDATFHRIRESFPMSWGLVCHALNEGGERASMNLEIDRPSGEAVQSSTRTAVLILGMHRSGTSSLAGTLVRLGGAAPLNLVPPDPDNTRGF